MFAKAAPVTRTVATFAEVKASSPLDVFGKDLDLFGFGEPGDGSALRSSARGASIRA